MKQLITRLLLLFLAFAAGCSSTWSPSQRAQLSEVGIGSLSTKDAAYHKPDPTQSPGMNTAITTATGGGLIPSLIGSAIDAKVMANQRKRFESTALEHFSAVEERIGEAPEALIEATLSQALEKHQFFGPLVSDTPTDLFDLSIVEHGYIRALGATENDMLLAYEITMRLTLTSGKGATLLKTLVDGVSQKSALIEAIVSSPELAELQRREAVDDLVSSIIAILDAKLGTL